MHGTLISADALQPLIGRDDVLIFDCRFDLADTSKGERLYAESHIVGAIYAHLDHHLSSPITPQSGRHPMPVTADLVNWLGRCGLTESSQVVVYDDVGGAMASRLWWLLKCLGHEAVALLDGGWQAWIEKSRAVNDALPSLTPVHYSAELKPDCVVTTDEVVNNLQAQQFALIDVRAGFRFRGEMEPIDPVAGHIPLAWNIPLTDNLNADGRFKSSSELQALYAELLSDWPPQQQVYMCGSGVTACHSVLAISIATGQCPRVYAGSWSEWIRDNSRPIATD